MIARVLAPLSLLAALVGGWIARRGRLAARVNADEERTRVLALLNARPDCGRGPLFTDLVLIGRWRMKRAAKNTNGASPKTRPIR